MQQNLLVVLGLLSAQLNALPLNINLGAYSPALVVGDGEISFGGKQDVSNLMNALEGAAVSGATAAAAAAAGGATQAQAQPQAQVVPAGAADSTTQITSLQGMGKEIAPRVVPLVKLSTENAKRDIAGFNAALNYATGALKTSPEVQLGTGEGGSGVGITQKAGGTVSTAAKAARSVEQVDVEGRDVPARKLKTTVTTMFVRGGPAQERSEDSASPMEKRTPAPSPSNIDGVNLNMAEGQVAELTFVETRAVEDDDEE
ncbi:uncharacterized protein PAC_06859 [Phialocephala subalpina]|uniref:Ppe family protein n=1 Tax=Phialocephala subalpina TaxID=576137 RepID=A0A1L7WW27_9HELO|nr:uncharacterized protein PAC_06859 [Phialocephala subalpina]